MGREESEEKTKHFHNTFTSLLRQIGKELYEGDETKTNAYTEWNPLLVNLKSKYG